MGVSFGLDDVAPAVLDFCRDYDPHNVKMPDQAPHFAALRVPFHPDVMHQHLATAYATGAGALVKGEYAILGF